MKRKTHKWTAKRLKVTKTWKLIHSKAWRNHLRVRKWNSLRSDIYGRSVSSADYKKLKALLPYSL